MLLASSVPGYAAVTDADRKILNLVNRISFGASTSEIASIKSQGFDAYLAEQLNPSSIDDSAFENKFLDPNSPNFINPRELKLDPGEPFEFRQSVVNRMINSKRQLKEHMAYFWDNHFSTQLDKLSDSWEPFGANAIETLGIPTINARRSRRRLGFTTEVARFNLNLDDYDTIELDLETKAVRPRANISWGPPELEEEVENDEEASNEGFVRFKVKNGKSQTYTIDVSEIATWQGNVGSFSLNFRRAGGRRVRVKINDFRLISSTDPSRNISIIFDDLKFEVDENDFFRENALGNFEDLLNFSAHSPRMLIYLDNWISVKGSPNENYARELMELHTMGVDGGYTQEDVVKAADLFTGWTTLGSGFYFNSLAHDSKDYQFSFINNTIPAGGEAQGNTFLRELAINPSTAEFICIKLIEFLVNDNQRSRSDALVSSCESTFLAAKDAPDQIAQVLAHIVNSAEFSDTSNYRAKILTPLEYIANRYRKLGLENFNFELVDFFLFQNRYNLFNNPVPTGYKEVGSSWLSSSSQLLSRIDINDFLLFDDLDNNLNPLLNAVSSQTDGSKEQVVDFIVDHFVGDDISASERELALSKLSSNFDPSNEDFFFEFLELVRLVINLPGANFS